MKTDDIIHYWCVFIGFIFGIVLFDRYFNPGFLVHWNRYRGLKK